MLNKQEAETPNQGWCNFTQPYQRGRVIKIKKCQKKGHNPHLEALVLFTTL